MSGPAKDFALLLGAPHPVRAELARDLLQQAGIPSLLHGQDRDFAEFGAAAHMGIARPDLYVPGAAHERARELLSAAWGRDWERDVESAPPA